MMRASSVRLYWTDWIKRGGFKITIDKHLNIKTNNAEQWLIVRRYDYFY